MQIDIDKPQNPTIILLMETFEQKELGMRRYVVLSAEQKLDIQNWGRRFSGQKYPVSLVMKEFEAKYGYAPSRQACTYWVRKALFEPARISVPPAYARVLDSMVANGMYPGMSEAAMAAIELLAASKEQQLKPIEPQQLKLELDQPVPEPSSNQGELTNAINQ